MDEESEQQLKVTTTSDAAKPTNPEEDFNKLIGEFATQQIDSNNNKQQIEKPQEDSNTTNTTNNSNLIRYENLYTNNDPNPQTFQEVKEDNNDKENKKIITDSVPDPDSNPNSKTNPFSDNQFEEKGDLKLFKVNII